MQSGLLDDLRTCVVVLLGCAAIVDRKSMERPMPTFQFDGASWVMYTFELGAVPATALRQKVGVLHEQGDAIRGAPDFLFSAVFDRMNLIA